MNYPHELAARHQREIEQVFETGKPVKAESSFTSPAGVHGFYEYIFNPVFAANGSVELIAGSTREISERKRNETNLAFLADLSQDLVPLMSEDEIIQSFGEKISRLTDASVCAFFEINEAKNKCEFLYEWHADRCMQYARKIRLLRIRHRRISGNDVCRSGRRRARCRRPIHGCATRKETTRSKSARSSIFRLIRRRRVAIRFSAFITKSHTTGATTKSICSSNRKPYLVEI